jgi:uncharacterized protein YciI
MRLALCLCLFLATCTGQETENYVFGFLRVHPERVSLPEAEANAIQKAHLEHLGKMSRDGYLVGAGPLIESPDLRGIVIFRGITAERARELASQDPAVINKRLRVHVEDWRSVKGIGDGIASKLKDPNFKIKMTRYGFVVSWWTPQAPKNWNSAEAKSKRKEQLEWFNSNASKLAASGPFADSREFASVAVFRSTDLEEIRKLAAEEPFVKAGWARPEVLIWLVAEGVMPESLDHR